MVTVIVPYSNESKATALRATLAFTNITPKALFTIPAGAVITEWILNVTTAFNADTTNVLDIGVSGTAQKFAASVDITTTGLKTTNVVAAQIGAVQATAQDVLGLYTPTTDEPSTGAMVIICRYYFP